MDVKIDDLVSWAVKNGAAIDPHVSFSKTKDRGIIALYDSQHSHSNYTNQTDLYNKNIRIPVSITINPGNAAEEFTSDFAESLENKNTLTKLYLAKQRSNQNSFFKAYIDSLPSLTEINSALTWIAADKELLKGTNLGNVIKDKMTSIVEEWFRLISSLPESIMKPESIYLDMKFYYDYKFYKDDELLTYLVDSFAKPQDWTNFANYLWASLILTSRSFPFYLVNDKVSKDQCILLPIIDLLNHQTGSKVEWSCHKDSYESFFEYKNNEINDGELFNNYGFKGNEELLMGYGFVMPDNKADTVVLRIKVPQELLVQIEAFGINLPDINDYTNNLFDNMNQLNLGDAEDKYKQYENGVTYFLSIDNIPDDLIKLFSFLVKKDYETQMTLRMRLDGLTKLRNAIEQKIELLNEVTLPKSGSSNLETIKIYRSSQKSIYNATKKQLKSIEKSLLNDHKSNLIQLKKIWSKDLKFKNSILVLFGVTSYEQILDSNFEDQTWLLWLMRCNNKDAYQEKDRSENYMSQWISDRFKQLEKDYKITETDRLQYKDLYNSMIPNFKLRIPEIYGVGKWDIDELIIGVKLLEKASYCRGSQGELILVEDISL